MISVLVSFLTSVRTWLLADKRSTGNTSFPASNRLVAQHAYFSGNRLIERVGGVWQDSGFAGKGALSDDGLVVAFAAYDIVIGGHALIYRRSSTDVSFSTVTPVTLDFPNSVTDSYAVLTPDKIALSGDGNRVVLTANHADRFVVATGISTGPSTWVMQTFSIAAGTSIPASRLTLNYNGTRLVVWYNTSMANFFYSGIPSLPWEDVGTLDGGVPNSSAWVSLTCLVVGYGGEVRVYNKQPASSSMGLTVTRSRAELGTSTLGPLSVLGAGLNSLMMRDGVYLLIFSGISSTGSWTLIGKEDISEGLPNNAAVQASPSMHQVVAVNNTNTSIDPYTTFLFER